MGWPKSIHYFIATQAWLKSELEHHIFHIASSQIVEYIYMAPGSLSPRRKPSKNFVLFCFVFVFFFPFFLTPHTLKVKKRDCKIVEHSQYFPTYTVLTIELTILTTRNTNDCIHHFRTYLILTNTILKPTIILIDYSN